ncbi:MAG: 3-deoxy-7-phosphoheptulonate synthase [Planctomycetota bacterium]
MIFVLRPTASSEETDLLLGQIASAGLRPLHLPGEEQTVLGALGDERALGELHLENHPAVESVLPVLAPYVHVGRELTPADTVVSIGGCKLGGDHFGVIAGPCAVESYDQLQRTATEVQRAGAHALRAGAFKPRTSPYSFQGLGLEGLKILSRVSDELALPTITEVVEVADIEAVAEHATAFQVGARNMQNFRLLTALGEVDRPVLIKRGMAATIEDLLLAAEYVVGSGNPQVILCERGIQTFEPATRNTLDLSAVPYLKSKSHLPVIVDPSHGTGLRELVPPMAYAAAACGADGIIVEVHRDPAQALSDGRQSLDPDQFASLMAGLRPFVVAAGKRAVN